MSPVPSHPVKFARFRGVPHCRDPVNSSDFHQAQFLFQSVNLRLHELHVLAHALHVDGLLGELLQLTLQLPLRLAAQTRLLDFRLAVRGDADGADKTKTVISAAMNG